MKSAKCILFIFLVFLILIPACTSQRTGGTVKDKGNQIELKTNDHVVNGVKTGQVNDTFVIFTANPVLTPDSLTYLDGYFVVIPKKDVDDLKKQYGNFVDTMNKGHDLAREKTRRLRIIAFDGTVQKRINEIIKLNSKRLYPVAKLTLDNLTVAEMYYKNSRVFLSGNVANQCLVRKIEVLEKNYSLTK